MAVIRPFRAIRPDNAYAEEIAALPYDVYSRKEAREAVEGRPLSFLNIDRPETGFPEEQDMYATEVYERAGRLLSEFMERRLLIEEDRAAYYLYELTMGERSQTGLVALSSIDDYLNGVCRKHENTVEEKEQDRIRHVDICSMQTGPIFLAYRARAGIRELLRREKEAAALFDFRTEDGIRHRGWKIREEEVAEKLTRLFSEVPCTYIADGHHRAASAVKAGLMRRKERPDYDGSEEFNYFLSVLFPDEELEILPYHRVVKDLNGWKPEDFMHSVEESFQVLHITEPFVPKVKGEICLYLGGEWFHLRVKEELLSERAGDPVAELDVSLLQELILKPLLGISDPRTDRRIEFVGGIRGLRELEKRVDRTTYAHAAEGVLEERGPAIAFAMHPTSIGELLSVADAGRLMPPKSTWFEPKLRSGLFLHRIEERLA